jgi:hypothetical protein
VIAATKESAKIFARDTSELLPCIELNVIELGSFRYALGYLRRIRASQGPSSPCDGGSPQSRRGPHLLWGHAVLTSVPGSAAVAAGPGPGRIGSLARAEQGAKFDAGEWMITKLSVFGESNSPSAQVSAGGGVVPRRISIAPVNSASLSSSALIRSRNSGHVMPSAPQRPRS